MAAALAGQLIGHDIQVHAELPSTSDHVRELGFSGYPHGTVVFAESQSAGRGRRDNRWASEPAHDLLLSILLRPEVKMECWPRLTTLAALALCRSIEETTSLLPAIKWPNDVYIHGKKTAGILAETFMGSSGAFMVLGIGLNVNTTSYPPELHGIATSLTLEMAGGPATVDRQRLAVSLLRQLNLLLPLWESGYETVVSEVRARSWLLGKPIRALIDGREVTGQASALNEEGHLLMQRADGSLLALTSAEQVRPL